MERCHRALLLRGTDTNPPRDAVCCLVSFNQKEDILRLARTHDHLEHEGARIQLFQDLSAITIQHRRDLHLILKGLQDRRTAYRWKFPFYFQATTGNHTALLRTPADLQPFCDTFARHCQIGIVHFCSQIHGSPHSLMPLLDHKEAGKGNVDPLPTLRRESIETWRQRTAPIACSPQN